MSYLVEIKGVIFSFKLRVDTTLDQLRQNLNLYMLIIAFDTENALYFRQSLRFFAWFDIKDSIDWMVGLMALGLDFV